MSDLAEPISTQTLMNGLSVQHVRFTVQALEPVSFFEQPGSALRGGLYKALSDHFCSEKFADRPADHAQRCPVCWLMAMEDPAHDRGRNIARPITVQPPENTQFSKGERLSFGIALIGAARDLLPYLVRAVEWMGKNGVGKGRGSFRLIAVHEYSPLWDAERLLMDGTVVHTPTLAVNAVRIADRASALHTDRITLHFLTPTELIAGGKPIQSPAPPVLMARLIERCQNLVEHYSEGGACSSNAMWKVTAAKLVEHASTLSVGYHEVKWVEAYSGSKRNQRVNTISGFTGAVRWEGNIAPLREWLLWGQSLHVGKNAVKGNGWYKIVI